MDICNLGTGDLKEQHRAPTPPNCSPQVGYVFATAKHMFSLIQPFHLKSATPIAQWRAGQKKKKM